jgi:hypothetical protein
MTVEKIVFSFDPQTVITDNTGNKLQFSDLAAGATVNAIGTPEGKSLVATQILVTAAAQTAAATSTISSTAASTATTVNSTSTVSVDKKVEGAFTSKEQTDANATDTTPNFSPADPNIATGGFIVENPNPQFHQ